MSPEDRELLHILRRQQLDLQRSLARLDVQLHELESRANGEPVEDTPAARPSALPPIPPHVELPKVPVADSPPSLPPVPIAPVSNPPLPPISPAPKPSLEFQFGRWLTRLGAVFLILSIVSFVTWVNVRYKILHHMGPWGKLGIISLVSVIVVALGQRIERKQAQLLFFGRTLMAAGLAGLYVTLYTACSYAPLRVVTNPWLAGMLLLWWSAYVFVLAERKQSQTLSLFAIALAYFSTAINPIGKFTMGADLLLAVTAVLFLVRNGWAALSYVSLVGTYAALLRRLVIDENGEFVFDTSRSLNFWPYAIYLFGAWLIFTAAVILCAAPDFRGGKRLAFLSLNNGAWSLLLLLTAFIAGYGHGALGSVLLTTGFVLLITSRYVGWTQYDPERVMAAYAAQGLALFTGGLVVFYTGATRGFLLLMETLFIGAAGAFSADRVLTVATYFTSFLATMFLIWEMAGNAHHPWLFGLGGAAIMLLNAWWSREPLRNSPRARSTLVLSTSYYCTLATGLVFTALNSEMSEQALPPALAFAALALTFLIYTMALYELPPIAQTLLLIAQLLVLFPIDTGEKLPWSSTFWVAVVTLVMLTWWTRQKITRTGPWTSLLKLIYALALAGLTYQAVRPSFDEQDWMIVASFLSIAFLAWGTFSRVWPIAGVGQVFLAISVYHFFVPSAGGEVFPWNWWAAMLPMVVVFSTARVTHQWLRLSASVTTEWRRTLHTIAYGYQLLALGMLIRWVCALVAPLDQIFTFLFLGTLVLWWATRPPSAFGVRCSFVLTLAGLWLYLANLETSAHALSTYHNGVVFFAFLAQPAILRRGRRFLITSYESWALILLSVAAGWLFISVWIQTRSGPGYLTMGWAFYALFLFLFGVLVRERRQRWCGLAILPIVFLRVLFHDMWGLSNGYKVLTFIVLTLITFSLGYLILRFADRARRWL